MTECPSLLATKSLTTPGTAVSRRFPPIKCDGRLRCFAARELATPFVLAVVVAAVAVPLESVMVYVCLSPVLFVPVHSLSHSFLSLSLFALYRVLIAPILKVMDYRMS